MVYPARVTHSLYHTAGCEVMSYTLFNKKFSYL